MRKIYGFVLFLVLFLFPLYGFSSHIVGGALTYVYNGGTSYTVTLKLYRDCAAGNAGFANTVTIQCQQADGSEFSPTRDFVLSTITTVSVTPVPPPCSTAPATAPCVEERTYRATVNLANAPGGMHLYWSGCCRNLGIDNLVAPSDSYGELIYAYIPGYQNEWIEGFSGLANGTTSDAGNTAWTRTLGSTAPNYASVQSQLFEVSGANNGSVTWDSEIIDISNYTTANAQVSLSETGDLDAGDTIKVFYSLDGGAYTLFSTNGQQANDPINATASHTGLVGSTLQIRVHVIFNGASPSSEIYRLDRVSVYDNTFVSNSNPVFNQVPPLYFCQTYQDTIDYSATDANGDSLVYSFYTPYDNVAPTFSENIASFTLVPWQTGYSATSPLNSGGPSLSINSATGQVSGIANTLGKYVFGIRCSEYRNGVLLSSVVRGYQVTTVTCPPFVPPTPTAGTSSPSPICTGQTLSLTASTIAGATGYTWSGPNSFSSTLQNPTISNVTTAASGTYSVSATVTGCTGAAGTVSITVNPTPASPTAGSNTPVCSGQTLSLTANTVAGSTYNWNGPNSFSSSSQNPTIANVTTAASGTYTVTRSSAAGCVSTNATTSVTINQTPNAPTASSNSPVCTGSTISLTASNTGTTYSWTGPNSFSSASQNPTIGSSSTANNGTYSVTATTNGCTGAAGTTSVTVNAIPATPTPGSNSPVCVGAVLSLTSNTISGATYNWSGPNSFSSSSQNPSFTPASTASNGTYSVSVTVNGCTGATATISVTVNPIPAAPTASSNSPVCAGQDITLSASSVGGATYAWTGPNSFSSASQNSTIASATTAANGTYSVTATVSGCTSTAGTTSVTVNPIPSAPTAGSIPPLCSGKTITLTASTVTGATYSWTGPNSFSSSSQNPTIANATTANAGTYSVSAIVSGCTSSTSTTSVTINTTPAAPTPGSNTPLCEGQTLNLTSNTIGSATYAWTGPASFSSALEDPSIANITTANAGTYSVTATVSGCVSSVATTSVTINATPLTPTAASNSPVCAGATLSLTSNTVGGAIYSWTGPNSFSSALEDPTISNVTTAASGTYSVTASVGGCTSPIGTTSVTINPIPAAPTAASNSPMCIGTTLSLTASNISGATYAWSGPNSFSSASQNPTIGSTGTVNSGTYSVTATVLGCTSTAGTTSVVVSPPPAAPTTGNNSPICTGYTLSLTANTIAGATYNWSGPNGFSSSSEDPTIAAITTDAAGTYSASVTVAGCTGSSSTTNVTINLGPAAPVTGSNSPVCSGSTLSLTASSTGVSYTWTGPNGFSSTLQNPTISSITTAGAGTYSVTATGGNGCVSTPTNTTSVTITPTPTAPVVTSNSPACIGGDISLTATTFAGASYSWSGPNSFSSALQNPVIPGVTTAAAGNYSVFATLSGCIGAVGTGSVTVNGAPTTPSPSSNLPVCIGQTLSLSTATIPSGTYNWSGPNGFSSTLQNPTITNVTAAANGTYSVYVTVPGCSSSGTGTLTVTTNATPATPTTSSNSPICTGYDLSLNATGTGVSYSWSGPNGFSSTTEDPVIVGITTAGSGNYSVTTTSAAGCISSAGTAAVTVNPYPLAPTASSNGPLCTGTTLSLTASTIGGATYSWTGPNSFSSALQNPTIANVTTAHAGTYSVAATVAGCTGAAGTVSVSISVPQTTTPSSNSAICSGQTLSLTATTVIGATYSWTGPNSFTSSSQNPTITNATVGATGTYSVAVTVQGCTGTVTTTAVTINSSPATPTAGSNSPVCQGSTISLSSNTIANSTYSWNGPNSFSSAVQNPTIANATTAEAGTYSVVATSTVTGCSSAAGTTSVTVNPPPSAPTLSSNDPVCTGKTLSLTASTVVGASYSWSGPNSFSSALQNPTISSVTTAAAGTYSVNTTVPGCPALPSVTIAVTINVSPNAPIASNNTPICTGSTISLSATSTETTFTWSGPNSFTSSSQNPTIASATTAHNGTYSVTVTAANGCLSSAGTTSVTISPIPSAPTIGTNSPLCEGQTLSLTASTIGGATYNWNGPNSFSSASQNPTIGSITTANAGTYSVNVTVAGCGGNTGTALVIINVIPNAPVAGSNSPVCEGKDLSLTASNTGSSYTWSGPTSYSATIQNPVITGITSSNAGTYSVTATANGCTSSAGTVAITVNPTPTISATSNSPVCEGNTISLSATTVVGATYSWNGPGGFSSTLQDPTIGSSTTANGGSYTVTATAANGCTSPNALHTVTITPSINVAAGLDQTICANNNTATLSGTVSGGTTTGIWSTSGTGGFIPGATNLSTNYLPSNADTSAGSITLTLTSTNNGGCPGKNDALILTITDAPTINAGADQTVCANNATVSISGNMNAVATGAIWSTSGTGTFANKNNLSTTYTPSAADTAAGTVILTLTTTGIGSCSPVSDPLVVTISDAPRVNAGANTSVCINNPDASLNGTSTTGSAAWTTLGSGSFSPNNTTLNATYTPSAADLSAGNVILILTSSNNGICNWEDDSITVFFTPIPVVNAGNDVTVCANNANVALNGTSSTGAGIWSTSGTGTFSPTSTTLNATYIPSSADTAAGLVALTLSSSNNGGCIPTTAQINITITDAPIVNAGSDQSVCANNAVVSLNGSFSTSSGALWSSSGTGTFSPDNTTMNATYTPSASDTAAGVVTLTLTSTGNGQCLATTDQMVITITKKPIVNAGINTVACKNNPNLPLSGYSSTGTAIWTTTGSGAFSPNATTLNATYLTSAADTTAGSVILILTTTNNGICGAEDDSLTLTYIEKPIINAGSDQTVCANNSIVTLNGTSNTNAGIWTTLGGGTFANSSSINTTYTPNAVDISNGNVTLILTSANNGTCNSVKDTTKIFFTPAPTVNAGNNQTVCANNALVTLNGSYTISNGAGWMTLGSGTFSPDTFSMNATYSPSAADTAAGTVAIVLASTGNGNCSVVTDTMMLTITDAPRVLAGNDQYICISTPTATLNGISTTGSGTWATLGTGTFANSNSLSTIYTASSADTSAKSVKLVLTSANNNLCTAITDTIILNFIGVPVVNIGGNQTVCANADTVALTAICTSNAGIWTTSGGGIFSPDSVSLNTSYIPNTTDETNGSVTIVFTSSGGCAPVTDTMIIYITPSPIVNAGTNQVICGGADTISLSGSVSGGTTTGIWSSSGTGIFIPNNTSFNTSYVLSQADSTAGGVTITLTSTNNGSCYAVSSQISISLVQPPVVNAGNNVTVCALTPVPLNGSVSGGIGTGVWSTIIGSGNFSPDSVTLNATYVPTINDTAFASLTFLLTSTNNGNCPVSTDTLKISLLPAPLAHAGNDINICRNNADTIQLSGTVTNAAGGKWLSSGNGTFYPNDSTLNGYYLPDSSEISGDTISIMLATSGNGLCLADTDTVYILINPSPLVNAGADIKVCKGYFIANLNGSVTGGTTTGIWTSLGSGYFFPNNTDLNTSYILSNADTTAGGTKLILTSTNNGNCIATNDTVKITITPAPVVNAGSDVTVCANNAAVNLNGSIVVGASQGIWTTNGTGTFSPNDSTLNAIYNPSPTDTALGIIKLKLTSIDGCKAVADSLTLTITNAPIANAGTDVSICSGAAVTLNGNTMNSNGGYWTSSGNGTFIPNDSTLNAFYIPGTNDTTTIKITLTTKGNGLCIATTDTMKITIGKSPIADFSNTNACSGKSITFNDLSHIASVNDSIISWSWNIGGINYTIQNPSHTYTVNGNDIVELIVTTNIGCTDTIKKTIHINATPITSYTTLNNCSADSVKFTNTSSITTGTIIAWLWNFGDGNTATTQHTSHHYDSTGTYVVTLTATSDSGCTSSFIDSVKIIKGINGAFSFNSNCDMSYNFSDISQLPSSDSIIMWNWNFGDGSTINTTQNPIHIYNSPGTYSVSLVINTQAGCIDTIKNTIQLSPFAVADFSPNGGTYSAGTTISFTDLSTNATSWLWHFGDGDSSIIQNPSHLFPNNGLLNIMLIVTNAEGCPDTIKHSINFNTNVIAIPSGFTPNGDNVNDVLIVRGGPLKEMDFRIYNEWGNELFRSTDQSIGWTGYYKNQLQPAGRYIYTLTGMTTNGEKIKMNGDVTIIR